MVFGDRTMNKNEINSSPALDFLKNHWLMALIIVQPVLDILAYWTKSPDGTWAGYIRLAIMLLLPVYLVFALKDGRERKRFILYMLAIAAVFALHILNCLRLGYVSMSFDISYAAKTAQMPILAVCFMFCIRNEQTKNQAYWGLFFAAAVTAASIGLAIITGTDNCTYGEGLGISGWVIDDNRCANSVILVTLAAFSVFCAVRSDKRFVNIVVPALVALVLISNGTKACYYSIFVIFAGFAVFLLMEKRIKGGKLNKAAVITLLALAVISAAVYPITPRCKVSAAQAASAKGTQNEIDIILEGLGYDLSTMTNEEKLADPVVREVFYNYYYKIIWHLIPDMFDRFTVDEILLKYDMTTDAATLIKTRLMKSKYAALMWDDCDALTKAFGFDVSDIWYNGRCDLENDWPAIFYYYGYVGIAAYAAFMLYFIWLIIRRVTGDFKAAFTADNFILLMSLLLLVGLAQFSGSVLRRPNVSVYLAVVLGLIYYQTVVLPPSRESSWRRLWT